MEEAPASAGKTPRKSPDCPEEEKWQYTRKNLRLPEKKHDTPRVLEPDHPLLEKFQKNLKDHLLKFLEHLKEDVYNEECGVKQTLKHHEEIGVRAYEIQQLVNLQQNQIDSYQKEANDVTAEIEVAENLVQDTRRKYKEEQQKLFDATKKERELRVEVESMDLLEFQMLECERTLESEIAVNQRIADKTHKDKMQFAEEKRQLDILTYKQMKEVWRLEGEIETMDMQLSVQEGEREKMAETITKANIEIETYEAEFRCLVNSWNSVIVAISQRDNIYMAVKEQVTNQIMKVRTIKGQIETVKKLCKKEMEQNENLTMIKSRIEYDIENLTKIMETETNKKNHLEQVMSEHQSMIDQMDHDYGIVYAEYKRLEHDMKLLVVAFEKLNKTKADIEEEILLKIQDQITNDKAAMFMGKLVRDGRSLNRHLEITLAGVEGNLAQVRADIEAQKCENENRQRLYDELYVEQMDLGNDINELKSTLAKLHHVIIKKQRDTELLKDKVDVIIERNKIVVSPEEQKIIDLEKTIAITEGKNKELQSFWLIQQVYVVRLSGERQQQIHDINLLRKQIMILQQKNLRITDDLEETDKKEKKIVRNVSNLLNRIMQLTLQFNQQKGLEEYMDKEKGFYETGLFVKLQDIEMECLKVEEEITQMENEKTAMSAELLSLNRVALEWEKKVILVAETKQKMQDEKSTSGEVGGMKAEIHRMEVRFSQLKRVQEQLIHDLESCVTRRDSIVALAEAREKRNKGGCSKTRIIFNRKLEEMRSKLRGLENQTQNARNHMDLLKEQEEAVIADIQGKENAIVLLQGDIEQLQNDVEIARAEKQKNLQILLHKQRQIKLYTDFTKGKFKPLFRSDSALQNEFSQQKKLNNKLITVVECLINDFPQYNHIFNRILNVLRVEF